MISLEVIRGRWRLFEVKTANFRLLRSFEVIKGNVRLFEVIGGYWR